MTSSLVRAATGAILAMLAAEVYVRPAYSLRVAYDAGIGYVNARGTARYGVEGTATSTWLDHGQRFTPHAPSGAPKVLVLGDSFTEALMIPDDKTFVAVAQEELQRDGVELELVNAGRSTMSAADYVALAPRFRTLYAPSWVVIELRSEDLEGDAWSPGRTRFVRDPASGALETEMVVEPERHGLRGVLFELRQRSMFLGYGAVRFGMFRTVPAPPLFRAGQVAAPQAPEPSHPIDEELDLLARTWGKQLTLLYLSSFSSDDLNEERVRSSCRSHRASCVFTREANEELRHRGQAPTGFTNTAFATGHMNEDGHAIAGRLLARELATLRSENARNVR